jgi:hypothetical protein
MRMMGSRPAIPAGWPHIETVLEGNPGAYNRRLDCGRSDPNSADGI